MLQLDIFVYHAVARTREAFFLALLRGPVVLVLVLFFFEGANSFASSLSLATSASNVSAWLSKLSASCSLLSAASSTAAAAWASSSFALIDEPVTDEKYKHQQVKKQNYDSVIFFCLL